MDTIKKISVCVFGDSHTDALKKALRKFHSDICSIQVFRYLKDKNGKQLGDLTVEEIASLLSTLEEKDMVVSMIGGNQHQVFSLVQHPVPFRMFTKGEIVRLNDLPAVTIPYNQIWEYFESGLSSRDGSRIKQLKAAVKCKIFHLVPPPPKEDSVHVLKRHEAKFINAGIQEKGVSPAPLRLKIWQLQVDVLEKLTAEWGVTLLPNPTGTRCEKGYLDQEYYANDATHANMKYGELVLSQLEQFAMPTTSVGKP